MIKKIVVITFIVFLLSFGISCANDFNEFSSYTVDTNIDGDISILNDGSRQHKVLFRKNNYVEYTFDNPITIARFGIYDCYNYWVGLKFHFYDVDNNLLYEHGFTSSSVYSTFEKKIEGIKKIKVFNPNNDLTITSEIELKASLKVPDYAVNKSIKKIKIDMDNIDTRAKEFNVYLNNVKKDTISPVPKKYSKIFDGLTSNTNYDIKFEFVVPEDMEIFDNLVVTERVKTLNYFAIPWGDIQDVTWASAKIKWDKIWDAVGYNVVLLKGEVEIKSIETDKLEYTFTNLEQLTTYEVKIRAKYASGYSKFKTLLFTTISPPEVPPPKPKFLNVLEVGTDFIKVEVSKTALSDSYVFYLDNREVAEIEDRVYTFDKLSEDTAYSVSCRSKNVYGLSLTPVGKLVRTKKVPRPRVTSVSSKKNGEMSNKKVKWKSENTSEVKVLVDGVEIGRYPANTSSIDIDFDKLGIEKGKHVIEVIPTEPNGIGYKLNVNLDGTGDDDLDSIISDVEDGTNLLKIAGIYLLLIIISVLIIFFSARWLFNKWRLGLVTRDTTQLEADPDLMIGKNGNTLDKEAYRASREAEKDYYDDKKDEKREIKSKYEFDKKLNRHVDSETGEIMPEGFNVKSKKKQLDGFNVNDLLKVKGVVKAKKDRLSTNSKLVEGFKRESKSFLKYAVGNALNQSKGGSKKHSYNNSNQRIKSLEKQVTQQQDTIDQLLKKLK